MSRSMRFLLQLLGGGLGGGLLVWFVWLAGVDPRLLILLVPLFMVLMAAVGTVMLRRTRRVRRNGRVALTRPSGNAGRSRLLIHLTLLGVFALNLGKGPLTLQRLGVSTEVGPLTAFAAGLLVYAAFACATLIVLRWRGVEAEFDDLALQAHALVVPRARGEKLMSWISVVLLNPVVEETLYRGLVVHYLGAITGQVGLALALGLIANTVNHLYQGWRMAPYHFCVFACAVALLYSPLGLVGAIGFHFGGDLVPMATMRRDLRRYRLRHSLAAARTGSSSRIL